MDGVDAIGRAGVLDLADAVGVGEQAARPIGGDRVVAPRAFPELVDHLHIFLGDRIAVVMGLLPLRPGALGGAVEIAGDDVPADPAFAEVVEGRHAPGEIEGRFVGQGDGDAEAEIAGRRGHRRDQKDRVVDRDLRAVAERRVGVAAEDVVDAEHIGEEDAVEEPALQRPRQFRPIAEPPVVP